MGCRPCAARRQKLAEELKAKQLSAAAKTAIEGAGMMLGLVKKEDEQDGNDEPSPGS